VRAAIRSVEFDPEPRSLGADPESFVFQVRLLIGPQGEPGEESFDLTVCSPEWLATECSRTGIVDGLHHLVVNMAEYNEQALRAWLEKRVSSVQGPLWFDIAPRLARLAHWEFDE
jgi:hypothetical protein